MRLRFTLAIVAAVVWSQVGYHYLASGWILLGAAVLGILFTIGIEPPRRRQHGKPKARSGLARRVYGHH